MSGQSVPTPAPAPTPLAPFKHLTDSAIVSAPSPDFTPRPPLAERLRPHSLADVIGQDDLIGDGKILTEIVRAGRPVNLILWGPPGTGKTTLARILAASYHADFVELSAVAATKIDIDRIIAAARTNWSLKIRTVLFIDEIHRFNKAQQDRFLPHVESGLITLIGATTENPSFEVIAPLISRSRVIVLKPLTPTAIKTILTRALAVENIAIVPTSSAKNLVKKSTPTPKTAKKSNSAGPDSPAPNSAPSITVAALDLLSKIAAGDARIALGHLELALNLGSSSPAVNSTPATSSAPVITAAIIRRAAGQTAARYDKTGSQHFDLISAFIKSLRGSDASAALYYLARMLQAGEDPKFIARRMLIFASEDIGLASSAALNLATSAFLSIERVGLPEGGIILSHVAAALAFAKKSRLSYDAWRRAEAAAASSPGSPPPLVICNNSTDLLTDLGYAKGYKWEAGFHAPTSYFPSDLPAQDFFHPPAP